MKFFKEMGLVNWGTVGRRVLLIALLGVIACGLAVIVGG